MNIKRYNLVKYFFAFFLLLFFVFRGIILNFSSNLIDWLDYPYYVWTLYQNIINIKSFNITGLFETRAFYPSRLTLLFSDTLIPQSLFALPFTDVVQNPILVFNFVFIITLVLDFISLFIFWNLIFKNGIVSFFGSIIFIFGPVLYLNLGHFQMLTYWPFFLSLYFLFKFGLKYNRKHTFYLGILLAIQFLASVYLAVFLLVVIAVWAVVMLLSTPKRKEILIGLLISLSIFFVIDGAAIGGYLSVRKNYNVEKKIKPAHISDYLFTAKTETILYQTKPVLRWNSFNNFRVSERAAFPGFFVISLGLYGLFLYRKKSGRSIFSIVLSQKDWIFLGIGVLGFWLSISPRLFFNGYYVEIPTGYNLVIRYFPILSVIRAGARWSFLVYTSSIYFAMRGMVRLYNKTKFTYAVTWALFILLFIEYIPIRLASRAERYNGAEYSLIKRLCNTKSNVLLEYPITHYNVKGGVVNGLNYISKVLLSSISHNCYLVNGYSGFDPPYLRDLHRQISYDISQRKFKELDMLFEQYDVDIVKVNTKHINKKHLNTVFWREYKNRKASPTIIIEN